jgi:RHS repeat-associated protein
LTHREEYFPFGETSFGSYAKKRYRFCGKERDDESGLYYYGARYYMPWQCRFVSVDPLAGEYPFYTPYQYAGNQPIVTVDIDGLEPGGSNNLQSPTGGGPTTATASGWINLGGKLGQEGNKIHAVEIGGTTFEFVTNASGLPVMGRAFSGDLSGGSSSDTAKGSGSGGMGTMGFANNIAIPFGVGVAFLESLIPMAVSVGVGYLIYDYFTAAAGESIVETVWDRVRDLFRSKDGKEPLQRERTQRGPKDGTDSQPKQKPKKETDRGPDLPPPYEPRRQKETISIFKAPYVRQKEGVLARGYQPNEIDGDSFGPISKNPNGRVYFAAPEWESLAWEYAGHGPYADGIIEFVFEQEWYFENLAQFEDKYQAGPERELVLPKHLLPLLNLNTLERKWHNSSRKYGY